MSLAVDCGITKCQHFIPPHFDRIVLYFACGGLGGMFGPWIMGIASDLIGINWGMALGFIFSAGIFFPILMLGKSQPDKSAGI